MKVTENHFPFSGQQVTSFPILPIISNEKSACNKVTSLSINSQGKIMLCISFLTCDCFKENLTPRNKEVHKNYPCYPKQIACNLSLHEVP